MNLRRKSQSISGNRYFNNIETCPVGRFQKVIETGNTEHLLKKGKHNAKVGNKAWSQLFDGYIKVFGLPRGYKQNLEKRVDALQKYAEWLETGKRIHVTMAKVMEREADMELGGGGEDFKKTCARISKFMGIQIDINTTTVYQFYSYIDLMKDGQ